jgi:hypothetical protein
MKKVLALGLVLSLVLWAACGSDSTSSGGNGEKPVTRLVANTSTAAPTLSHPDEVTWSNVKGVTVTLARSGAVGKGVFKAAIAPATVDMKAIVKGDSILYLRFEWVDDSLHLWRDVWTLNNVGSFNFSRTFEFNEDGFYAMFTVDSSLGWDVWNWRSLTTNSGNLAEGFNFSGGQLDRDSGVQLLAVPNYDYVTQDESRPMWIHKTKAAFTDPILYKSDVDSAKYPGEGWTLGQKVPGYVIDLDVLTLLAETPESRWDIKTTFAYDHANHKMKLAMGRKLNTGFGDDLNMAPLDSVWLRVGVLDHQDSLTTNNSSQQGFSTPIWLIL